MISRCNFTKNIKKYYKSINHLKDKWNITPNKEKEFILKCSSVLNYTNGKLNQILQNKDLKNIHDYGRNKLNDIRILLKKQNLQSLSNKLTSRLTFATTGFTIIETKGKEITPTPVAPSTPSAKIIYQDPLPDIPEPPAVTNSDLVEVVATFNGEPPFESLGLGGWSPVGIVQNCLEYLHITLDIPWWGTIVIGTIVVRILMFPLVIISQRNGAKMNNYLPQLQVLQLKMTEARQTGNQLDAARYGQEMMLFMKEKQLNPLKNMIVPLAQMPLFISFFIGLRQMANCPVESMQHGGLFWFTDLTLPDQYFILPIITSLTMWATIEVGTDTAKLSAQNLQMMKYVLRAMPLVILPFTVNFPGAILCYWVCTNFISLGQVGILRIPKVRNFFKIEALVTHKPENLPIKSKGFVSGMKDSWTNMKITGELEGRKRYDEMQFQRAGKGPIVKTYKFDPTKHIAAKKSS